MIKKDSKISVKGAYDTCCDFLLCVILVRNIVSRKFGLHATDSKQISMILNDYKKYIQDLNINICTIFILLYKENRNVTLRKNLLPTFFNL